MKAILVLTSTNPFFEEELKSLCEACHIEVIDVVIQKLEKIKNGDILVLSGSVSKGIENNIYEEICEKLKEKEIKIIVDTTKDLLLNTLKYKPFLISSPNYYK